MAVLKKSPKVKKTHLFGHLIQYDPELSIFQKNHQAQTMGPIVLYTHAKNQENT